MNSKITSLVKTHWGLLFAIICVVFALFPLFQNGFFSMHDDEQIARLYEFNDALKSGQFPPRWVSHLGFGYGYPLFNFYPPFIYYLGEMFHLLGFSLINATKLVMGCGFILSSIFMYIWVKKHFGEYGGIFAAVLYTYVPYHAIDLYVRGALAEFFSFVWIPAVFWSFEKLTEEKTSKWVVISSMFLALIVITHSLIALPFLLFFTPYMLFLLVQHRSSIKTLIILFGCTGFLGLGLSAFFWLPSLLEKQYTLVDTILLRELANYNLHFVYLRQFWSGPWGYGGSIYGLEDGLSFQVGKLHFVISFLIGIISVVLFIKNKNQRNILLYSLCIFIFSLFSLFMASFHSKPLWDIIKPLAYLQFPWRFLLFTAVFSSFLGGAFISWLQKLLPKKIVVLLTYSFIIFAIWLVFPYFQPRAYLPYSDSNYTTNNDIEWRVSEMSFEYVSKEVATTISKLGTTQIEISKNDIPKKSFQIVSGSFNISESNNTPSYKKYLTDGKGGILQINTYVFPGWKVFVDGKEVAITPVGKYKLISFPIKEGRHVVEVKFENTQPRTIGNTLTIITFFGILIIIFFRVLSFNAIITRLYSFIKRKNK